LLDRVSLVLVLAVASACVSNTSDIPAVSASPPSGEQIYILAAGERAYPYAARGHWGTSAELAADLESAGFRPSVVLDASGIPSGGPTIESIVPGGECFSHAFLTVLTAGIIPELGCREYGHRFELRCSPGAPVIDVNARFKVRSYVGWFVWPLAISPNWVYDSEGPPAQRPEQVSYLRRQLQAALASEGCAA
jgi:hypothetical protein